MRLRSVVLAALMTASCLSGSCGNSAPDITAPTPPAPDAGAQQPTDNPTQRPPEPPVPPTPVPPAPEPPDRCDHRKAQWAIGQRGTQDVLDRARLAAGAEFARFLRIGEAVTLEYRVGRLNLGLDEEETIRNVLCW